MLSFENDYSCTATPEIIERISEIAQNQYPGYGNDSICESAKAKIREACACPDAQIFFLVGGTQTNQTIIDSITPQYAGVIAASTGHVNVHEAGAIEFTGHKVLTLPHHDGKIDATELDEYCATFYADGNYTHMVFPGCVYISQATEYGTLYSLDELSALRATCDAHGMKLYVDGARLAYALAAPRNNVQLSDLARLADAFYIGGTKCGALLGEAMVFPKPSTCPHFFTLMKRRGALLAKGMVTGIQFETLLDDGLYQQIGAQAVAQAERVSQALKAAGCELMHPQETNQVFVALDEKLYAQLSARVEMSFWEQLADGRTVVRLATSWATADEDVDALVELLGTSQ